jgi:hypothetical protein
VLMEIGIDLYNYVTEDAIGIQMWLVGKGVLAPRHDFKVLG